VSQDVAVAQNGGIENVDVAQFDVTADVHGRGRRADVRG
jgi:hypothetical protein